MAEAGIRKTKEAKPRPPFHSVSALLGASDRVIVKVGPEEKEYHVQKAFLTHYSGYFEERLSVTWNQDNKEISLIEVEPPVFNVFLEWLYTQKLPKDGIEWYRVAGSPSNLNSSQLRIQLYVFSDRFIIPSLRIVMNREIVKRNTEFVQKNINFSRVFLHSFDTITYAFNNLPSSDPILDFLVDTYVMAWMIEIHDIERDLKRILGLPHDFLAKYMLRIGELRGLHSLYKEQGFKLDLNSYCIGGQDSEEDASLSVGSCGANIILLERRE